MVVMVVWEGSRLREVEAVVEAEGGGAGGVGGDVAAHATAEEDEGVLNGGVGAA